MSKYSNYIVMAGGGFLIFLFFWYLPSFTSLPDSKPSNYILTDFIKWSETSKGLMLDKKNFLFMDKTQGQVHLLNSGDLLTAVDFKPLNRNENLKKIFNASEEGHIYNYTIERNLPDLAIPLVLNYLIELKSSPLFLFPENRRIWNLHLIFNVMGCLFYLMVGIVLFPFFRRQPLINSLPFLIMISGTILWFFTALFRQFGIIAGWSFVFPALDSLVLEIWIFSIFLTITGWFLTYPDLNKKVKLFLSFILLLPFITFEFIEHIKHSLGNNLTSYTNYLLQSILIILLIFFSLIGYRFFQNGKRIQAFFTLVITFSTILICWFYPLPDEYSLIPAMLLFSFPAGISSFRIWQVGNVRLVLTKTLLFTFAFIVLILFYFGIHSILPDAIIKSPYTGLSEILLLILIGWLLFGFYKLNIKLFSNYFTTPSAKKEQCYKELAHTIIKISSSATLLDELSKGLMEYLNSKNVSVKLSMKNFYESGIPLPKNFPFFWSQNKILSPFHLATELEKKLILSDVQLLFIEPLKDGRFIEVSVEGKRKGKYSLEEVEKISALLNQARLTLDLLTLLEKEKELSNQRMEANLKALRAQINPHFLFNTLNTISSLVREKPELAEKIVDSLAGMFRKTLNLSDKNLLTLEEELGLVKDYLTIEKARFGERLNIRWNIESGTEKIEIPAFCLQTLIENSIKHGISKEVKHGIIEISAKQEGGFLKLKITDNGAGFDTHKTWEGHGLKNIQSRFFEHYGSNELVNIKSLPEEGTEVELRVPVIF